MGTIKHEWVGTTLIITSDSGTSSCDLKGDTGDMGVRGAQGPCGVIYGADGEAILSNYVTMDKLMEVLAAIDIAERGAY